MNGRLASRFVPFLALALVPACAARPASPSARPNVVLILFDDLGSGDLGCTNPDSRIPTPHLDRFATQSRRLLDAHSPSGVCTPTRYGLLTGRYAWRTSLEKGVLWGDSPLLIDTDRDTLAKLFARHGYRTACFGKWHLGLGSPPNTDYARPLRPGPLECGFDTFEGIAGSLDMTPYVWIVDDRPEQPATKRFEEELPVRYGGEGFVRPGPGAPDFRHADILRRTVDRAIDWTRDALDQDEPFFLYLPLTAPHTPWLPDDDLRGTSGAGPYGDFVSTIDRELGKLFALLDERALDNTLVVVTSDNGAHWTPQEIEHFGHRANLDYRGQKADIWEGGHRVPFFVRWPGRVPAGTSETRLFSHTDFHATFAELLEDPAQAPDSQSALALWLGNNESEPTRERMVQHSFEGTFAMRSGRYKWIEGLGSGGFTDPWFRQPEEGEPPGQLYDLERDPSESDNLYALRPEVVERLKSELAAIRQQED